uniref:HTH-type transcriptional regulator YvaF n=1 Tax=uncultured bacterium pBIO2079 TaxID=1478040 RepID=A0A075FBX8_9BACT|nr:HTH-type transcriptional regulator YvaF [uncultured bacterium pBIO2079]
MDIRERIVKACRDLAAEQGLQGFTMDELAQRAGVSKRTVYRYFDSKESIIEASLEQFMSEAATRAEDLLAQNKQPAVFIQNGLNYLSSQGQFIINPSTLSDLRLYYPQLWDKIDDFRIKQLRKVLDQIMTTHPTYLQNIDPSILSTVIVAAIQNVLNPTFILENNLTFEETARQLSLILTALFQ